MRYLPFTIKKKDEAFTWCTVKTILTLRMRLHKEIRLFQKKTEQREYFLGNLTDSVRGQISSRVLGENLVKVSSALQGKFYLEIGKCPKTHVVVAFTRDNEAIPNGCVEARKRAEH